LSRRLSSHLISTIPRSIILLIIDSNMTSSSSFSPVIASTMPKSSSPAEDTVSLQVMEHLWAELVHYSIQSTQPTDPAAPVLSSSPLNSQRQRRNSSSNNHKAFHRSSSSFAAPAEPTEDDLLQRAVLSAEMSAAKLERVGYQIGYRLTERLAQTKTWNALTATGTTAGGADLLAQQTAAQQLEAVKFLCKDVWVQLFGKPMDKLQTNHRGVFVLKDLQLSWLLKFPESESSRTQALQWLALPCGLIRGCLADLGIPSVVSCDFATSTETMAACSFNIKVK
jgi:hypothetical protein